MTTEYTTYAVLPDISNTFRVLIDYIDFSEEDSDGWQVLVSLCYSTIFENGSLEAKRDLLFWMLQLSRFEVRMNVIESKYVNMLYRILKCWE